MFTLAMPDPAPSPAVASTVTVPLRYWPGSVTETLGAVLSTIAPEKTVEVAVLPALSVASDRKSYWPSDSELVLYEHEYGEVVSEHMSLHAFRPIGLTWDLRDATPEPAVSVDVPSKLFVPGTGEPGFVIVAVGAVLSSRRLVTADEVVVLLALSVVIARRS